MIWPSDPLADPIEVRFQFGDRIGLVEFRDAVPEVPEVLVSRCRNAAIRSFFVRKWRYRLVLATPPLRPRG
jgi:hypothetical protein